jgi:AcrR family transcriptional regulator
VRDIAEKAGVNHGLIHRYFGSKEALVRAAVKRTSAAVNAERPTPPEMAWTLRLFRERPELARIVARCCLDGPTDVLKYAGTEPAVRREIHATIRAALERTGLGAAIDPRVLNALGVAALLGWVVFRPLLDAAFDLPKDADARMARVAALVDRVLGIGG